MSDFDDFFNQGGGDFIPTAKFTKDSGPGGRTQVGGGLIGTIESMSKQQQRKFGSDEVILDKKTGEPKTEIKVVLQTDYRNWDKCAKVPTDDDGNEKPGSEDDGRRAVYVRGWMTGAIGDAVKAATGKAGAPAIGGRLGVKVTELVPTDQGNPYPKFEAVYTAPAPVEDGFFDKGEEGAAPAAQPAPAAAPAPAPSEDEPPF